MTEAQSKPASAPAPVIATETRRGKFQVEVQAGGVSFLADEPIAFGGMGTGPNPHELLAAALGACTAMTVRLYAEGKGWPLERVQTRVERRRVTPGEAESFVVDVALDGELDEAQRARLLEIAARCPVHRTLERGSIIEVRPARASGAEHLQEMQGACDELDG